MTWSRQLSKNPAGKQFISHLLQIVHANYRGFKIFNVRPGILLNFGWELCPTFDLEMIYDRCQLRLCTLTSWWRRAHGFKICLQKGHQEENDDPWCFRVATLVWKNSAKNVQNKATECYRGVSHLRFQTVHQQSPRWGQQLFHWSPKCLKVPRSVGCRLRPNPRQAWKSQSVVRCAIQRIRKETTRALVGLLGLQIRICHKEKFTKYHSIQVQN